MKAALAIEIEQCLAQWHLAMWREEVELNFPFTKELYSLTINFSIHVLLALVKK